MLIVEARSLLRKLNPTCTKALEAAASACIGSRHYEVTVEHVLLTLLDDAQADVAAILENYRIDRAQALGTLQRYVSDLRSGNSGKPVFSSLLLEWIQDSWLHASTELQDTSLRSGALFLRLVLAPSRYIPFDLSLLDAIPRDELRAQLVTICSGSREAAEGLAAARANAGTGAAAGAQGGPSGTGVGKPEGPLAKYTSDLTERARRNELDPVLGREMEIRQMVDILVRRRKNNPIIVGEAGVGKTALVEGLALRIVEGSVPDQLKDVSLLALDLGALQAGAGVKGEFEQRLKGVINEIKASPRPIVLFIDEAHTIIGAGGPQGGGDAANLLKPALARGELRTIAATTYAEFKKYFEKDAALERRFQPVRVGEPSVEVATQMLRGVAERFSDAHSVLVTDEAVRAAVHLSSRYISGRQLPDKAVDLLDTAAARAKVMLAAPPPELEDTLAALAATDRELNALARDEAAGYPIEQEHREKQLAKQVELKAKAEELRTRLAEQRAMVDDVLALRKRALEGDAAARIDLPKALEKLRAVPSDKVLVRSEVDETLVSAVVADWTGIPVGRMVRDDLEAILKMEDRLRQRVRGQDAGLALMARELRAARADLKNKNTPLGVFLLVGPSGVGKTETALTLAELLFGGERFVVTINMSEFQERHTVSRLVGSPPGYVGYGQGGVLTEAVRHRPYSVVLLDEVEKADKEVLNIFYQVFDKGMLADGEGRVIDFKNTVIVMTSNLASDLIVSACTATDEVPDLEQLNELVRPTLSAHFKPALLARMTTVPFVPINTDALAQIVLLKTGAISARARESHDLQLNFGKSVIDSIVARCKEVESGARNIDHILRGSILPVVSNEILRSLASEQGMSRIDVELDEHGNVVCHSGGVR